MLFEVIFDSVKKVVTMCQGRYTDDLVGEEVTKDDLLWLKDEGWRVNPSSPSKWEAYSVKGRVTRNLLA